MDIYHRHHQNYLAFRSLARFLANENMLLILKFPSMTHCMQYWALIPPPAASLSLPTDSSGGEFEVNHARDWDQMTLIHLVDKDDLMIDIESINDDSRTATKTTLVYNDDETMLEDDYTVAEIESYFAASLKSTLGPPIRYNPFACPSKKIDMLVCF